MSDTENKTLSGTWTGVFDYDENWGEATPFNAMLTETSGTVSGEICEPNTFASDQLPEIFASLSGARDGFDVEFVKTYEQRPGAGHRVRYQGVANAKLDCIRGEWSISGGFGGSGPFVMNRSGGAQEEAKSTEEATEEPLEMQMDGAPPKSQ